jgi:hypothetical protein
MRLRLFLIGWISVLVTFGQAVPPAEEQSAFIEQVRKQALAYDESLPNFICTQETRRTSAGLHDEKWKELDTLTIRLSYFGRKEDYRVVQVNGKPADKAMNKVGGWKTNGDFGSMLHAVFMAKSQAKFQWERSKTWNGRPVAVLTYHIDREHSTFNSSASGFLHSTRVVFGVDGTIYADAETNQVLRLTVDARDLPATYPVREIHIALEYAKQKIGDSEYLLPAKSVSESVMGKDRRKSETRFIEYRKFSTDTAIKYGDQKL